jgi:hypothetical protein
VDLRTRACARDDSVPQDVAPIVSINAFTAEAAENAKVNPKNSAHSAISAVDY